MINYNLKSFEITVAAADGAQSSLDVSPATISSKQRLHVAECYVSCDADNSVNVAARLGFAASSLTAAALTGISKIVLVHPDIAPGSGTPGLRGITGAAGDKLLFSCDAPTGGSITLNYSYEIVPG